MATVTLTNVVEELKKNREIDSLTTDAVNNLVSAVNNFLNLKDKENDKTKLNNEEARRENRKPILVKNSDDALGAEKGFGLGIFDTIKSVFTGTLLTGLVAGLAKYIWNPLKFLARLVIRSGPLALLVTSVYVLLRDIGDNPAFSKTIQKIKNTWNNKVIPMFDALGKFFADISGSTDLSGVMGGIQDGFKWLVESLTRFKVVFQTTFISLVNILGDFVGGIADSISMILNGDWKAGLSNLFFTVTNTLADLLKGLGIFVVDTIGAFLGFEEGGLGVAIESLIKSISTWIKDGIKTLKDFFIIEIPALFFDIRDWSVNKFWEIFDGIKTYITTKLDEWGIPDLFSKTIESIKEKFTIITDGFKALIDYVTGIPGRIKEYILSILPDWLKPDSNGITYTPFVTPTFDIPSPLTPPGSLTSDQLDKAKSDLKKYLTETTPKSRKLLEQPAPFQGVHGGGGGGAGLVIAQDNRTTVNNTSATTSIMSWSSPMADYSPF